MELIIREINVKSVLSKSSLPVSDYSANPYVGCTHACQYCYASFMKRFTNHPEEWGHFLDVKYWPVIRHPERYCGKKSSSVPLQTHTIHRKKRIGVHGLSWSNYREAASG